MIRINNPTFMLLSVAALIASLLTTSLNGELAAAAAAAAGRENDVAAAAFHHRQTRQIIPAGLYYRKVYDADDDYAPYRNYKRMEPQKKTPDWNSLGWTWGRR